MSMYKQWPRMVMVCFYIRIDLLFCLSTWPLSYGHAKPLYLSVLYIFFILLVLDIYLFRDQSLIMGGAVGEKMARWSQFFLA